MTIQEAADKLNELRARKAPKAEIEQAKFDLAVAEINARRQFVAGRSAA